MLIKHNNLLFQLPKKLPVLFFLIGQEPYQINQFSSMIKQAWKSVHADETEITTLTLDNNHDWAQLAQEANSYSLFSSSVLIDISYDKKTLESTGKQFLLHYLNNYNSHCLLLFKAPLLSAKQLQPILNHELAYIIQISTPSHDLVKKWLHKHLEQHFKQIDPQIPNLIYQFNEGNLLACTQLLEKLQLTCEADQPLSLKDVKEQLSNQCAYPLFELTDTCLTGNSVKAIQLLRQACGNKTEPTLLLWLLTQETRRLMQLVYLTTQTAQPLQNAINQLHIWTSKMSLYQAVIKKYNYEFLTRLLKFCNQIDMRIKTTSNKQAWQALELIALSLCTGYEVGSFV